jgi:glutathione peroxidase
MMKRTLRSITRAFTAFLAFTLSFSGVAPKQKVSSGKSSIYEFDMKTLDGKTISLSRYKGKKMLIVNVASECGYTPQYKGLQELHEKYGSKVAVIGFPSNDFGGQEPGSAKDIELFCQKNYGVTFQLMEKISVKGGTMHPLYRWLSNKEDNGSCDEAPNWNFCKYLVDEHGKVVKFFRSKVEPMSEEITSLL